MLGIKLGLRTCLNTPQPGHGDFANPRSGHTTGEGSDKQTHRHSVAQAQLDLPPASRAFGGILKAPANTLQWMEVDTCSIRKVAGTRFSAGVIVTSLQPRSWQSYL